MELTELKHVELTTKSGARVFVLETGSIIGPESEAMLQALHSRSVGGIKNHLQVLAEKGSDDFMSKFYVGYGHKSIGDCASTTIFIEGISQLAAKALEDNKLFSGQEASTRYVDFSKQLFIDSSNSEKGKEIMEELRSFYLSLLPVLNESFKKAFPIQEGQSQNMYDKAIAAKSFDVARGFLPAGASTNIAWHSNLRQVSDRLLYLRNHPLQEVRDLAEAIEDAMIIKFPNSFSKKRYEDTENYAKEFSKDYYFLEDIKDFDVVSDSIKNEDIEKNKKLFDLRPNSKTELPVWLNNLGTIKFQFLLDFGSFRDVQRHRAVFQRMPLLTEHFGFSEWYLSQLPEETREKAKIHLSNIKEKVESLDLSKEEKQYFIPMGYLISNEIMGTLPSLIYMIELRSTQFVHPTLRVIAQKMSKYISETHNIKLFTEMTAYDFDINRGKHDITIK